MVQPLTLACRHSDGGHRAYRTFTLAFAILIASAVTAVANEPDLIVNTSHQGSVEQLHFNAEEQLLVSGSSDGSVRVWDADTQELLRNLQVTQLPIRQLASHPSRPEVAVVVQTSEGYRLSVWDYMDGEELYFQELQSEPLHMSYSPKGTWLVYSQTAAESVVMLDSETGERDDRVEMDTGIVSYFTIGGSETNIMTYAPADGRIQYTRLEDGNTLQEDSTVSNLQDMHVLENRRFAAARDGDDLVIIDILDGSERDRVTRERIRDIKVDSESGRIAVLHGQDGSRGIEEYEFDGDSLSLTEEYDEETTAEISAIEFVLGNVFSGGPEGRLALVTDEELDIIAENELLPVRSVAFGEYSMLVTANDYASSIKSDFFGSMTLDDELQVREQESGILPQPGDENRREIEVSNPEGDRVVLSERFSNRGSSFTTRRALQRVSPELELSRSDGFGRDRGPEGTDNLTERDITISYLENEPWDQSVANAPNLYTTLDSRILLWDSPDIPMSLVEDDDSIARAPNTRDESIRSLVGHDAAVTVLYSDGVAEQRHPITFEVLQDYDVGESLTAAYIRDSMLLVGRNASGRSGSALTRVDPETGETVNLDTEAFYVFRIAVDRQRGAAYVLGLSRGDEGLVTTVERITGEGLRETELLHEVPTEDLESDITVDERTGTVYIAAGLDGVLVWDGSEIRTLPQTDHLARRLVVGRGKVLAVNVNGTISIWNQASEEHLGDVYLFEDGRWLALGPDGGYFTAEDMDVVDLLRAPEEDIDIAERRAELPVTISAAQYERGVELDEVLRSLGRRETD
ncbi:MAG: hypothetical protein ACLFM0_00230 [Spirochaetales bacterium]